MRTNGKTLSSLLLSALLAWGFAGIAPAPVMAVDENGTELILMHELDSEEVGFFEEAMVVEEEEEALARPSMTAAEREEALIEMYDVDSEVTGFYFEPEAVEEEEEETLELYDENEFIDPWEEG